MDYRSFTTICAMYHAQWLADQLGLTRTNGSRGIDTADNETGVELKNRMRTWYPSWTIHAYQIKQFPKENKGKDLFWGFLLYDLTKTVPRIRHRDFPQVITDREIWLMPWAWVEKFPVHHPETGPYVYVRQKHLPDQTYFAQFQKPRGTLYVPKGSSLEERLR